MAYPESIPPLKGKQAERFLRNLENFSLTKEQVEFYREAINRMDKERSEEVSVYDLTK